MGLLWILGLGRLFAGLALFAFFSLALFGYAVLGFTFAVFGFLIFGVGLFFPITDLLVLARELDHLRGDLGIDAVDGGEIIDRGVEQRVEVIVAGTFELVGPLGRHVRDVVDVGRGAGLGHRFLQHGRERVGNLSLDLFFRLDVDLRADQLGGQPDVETALADGQRELIVVDDHVQVRAVGILVPGHGDARDLGGRQRVLGEVHDVLVPGNDVDLLAAQLTDDRLHARPIHTDARADRIDVALPRHDRNLGPLAGLADRALDHHRAVVDLRHFHLEEFDEQAWVGARKHHLWPLRLRVYIDDHGLDAVALRVAPAPPLLPPRDDSLGLAVEVDDHVAALEALDITVLQFAELVPELVVDLLPLGLADLLVEDLLGRLGGDASEVTGRLRQRDMHLVALLDFGVDLLGLVRADLGVVVLDDVDHFLGDVLEADPAADPDFRIDRAGLFEGPLSLGVLDLVLVLDDLFADIHLHLAAVSVYCPL